MSGNPNPNYMAWENLGKQIQEKVAVKGGKKGGVLHSPVDDTGEELGL